MFSQHLPYITISAIENWTLTAYITKGATLEATPFVLFKPILQTDIRTTTD